MPCKKTHILLLILMVIGAQCSLWAQYSRQIFGKLSIEDGLSQSVVNAIIQDKYGCMWFGTNDGLNKYDGYNFKVYQKQEGLTDASVKCLLNVNDTLLWIGTKTSGINILNLKTNKFIQALTTENCNLNSNSIKSMRIDENNCIWVATDNGINKIFSDYKVTSVFKNNKREYITNFFVLGNEHVIYCKEFEGVFEYKNGISKKYKLDKIHPEYKSNDNITLDKDSTLWLATNAGLYYKYKHDSIFREFDLTKQLNHRYSIHHLFVDHNNNIWFNVHSQGLFKRSALDGTLTSYSEKTYNASKVDLMTSLCSYIDRSGLIWIGTNGYGIQYFYPEQTFQTISFDLNSSFRTSSRSIRKITNHLTDSNLLWIGGYSGLDLFHKKQGLIKNYNSRQKPNLGFLTDAVFDILHYNSNNVLVCTEGDGLFVFDIKQNKFLTNNIAPNSPNYVNAYKAFADSKNNIWLGTNNGLYSYNIDHNLSTGIYNPEKEAQRFYVTDLYEVGSFILMATNKGLYAYNTTTKSCNLLKLNTSNVSEPSINNVLVEDDLLTLSTNGYGIFQYRFRFEQNDIKLDFIKSISVKEGLPNDVVYGILKDNNGEYWSGTNKGLFHINKAGIINTYYYTDGLQGNEYNLNANFKDKDGTLYFGGINGLSYFNPTTIKTNQTLPLIYFTSYKVFNNEADTAFNLNEITELQIPYFDNVLTFSFASSDYTSNKKLQYAYKLVGFNNDFINLGSINNVTFTNLDPGEYTLKIIGTNSNGIWNNEGRSLKIRIIPPFWKTPWFIIYCILFGAALVYFFVLIRVRSIRNANTKLEREVIKRTIEISDKNKELAKATDAAQKSSKAKAEFLATMSHEIRTPMNGLVGVVSLLENTPLTSEQKNYIDVISTSTDNLIQVINDILDFSKIESGKLDLFIEEVDVYSLLENTIELFRPKAIEKNLDFFVYISPTVPLKVITDETRLKQILFNLISNALKFTNQGYVYIEVTNYQRNEHHAELTFKVEDTGIGIPKDKQTHIFQSFTQADSSTSRKFGGTGLGLTICKKLVEMMHGEISLLSESGKGAQFIFTISTQAIEANTIPTLDELMYTQAIINFKNEKCVNVAQSYLDHITVETIIYNNELDESYYKNAYFVSDDLALVKSVLEKYGHNHVKCIYLSNQKLITTEAITTLIKPITPNKLYEVFKRNNDTEDKRTDTQTPVNLAKKYPLSILVAEDHHINQLIINKMFQSLGYNITMVDDGVKAYNIVKNGQFDLVFMDIHMPEMDGVKATQKILEDIPMNPPVIIALTASVITDEINEYKDAGIKDVLAKPLALDDLKNCIERWGDGILQKNK